MSDQVVTLYAIWRYNGNNNTPSVRGGTSGESGSNNGGGSISPVPLANQGVPSTKNINRVKEINGVFVDGNYLWNYDISNSVWRLNGINKNGAMVIGWKKIVNDWYYFGLDGVMLINNITHD